MLKILLWKIGFEWRNIRRIFWPGSDKVYYFAFGANLSPDVLARRSINTFDTLDFALDGATLEFSQPGFHKGHGYASADEAPGEVVYGRLYLIRKSDAERMDYFEGVPFMKVHQKIHQRQDNLDFYYYRATSPKKGLRPTKEYLNYLVDAYRQMPTVPDAYITTLAQTPVLETLLPQDQTGTFVQHIEHWPTWLHPMLIRYEATCLTIVKFLWHRSLFQWLIRNE